MNEKVEMIYIGSINNEVGTYEVIEDVTSGIVNLFYKNTKYNEVECISLPTKLINKEKGKSILSKTKSYWNKIRSMSEKELDSAGLFPFMQTFPIGFWDDMIPKFKSGDVDDLNIVRMKVDNTKH